MTAIAAPAATGRLYVGSEVGALRRVVLHRPDLEFVELRGNIQTRLSKVPTDGALVMAVAALDRLGLGAQIAQALDPSVMLPQVAQGALAVECRDGDAVTGELLSRIEHAPSRHAVDGERAFLATLGGGCDLPVGAYVVAVDEGWRCEGLIADLAGSTVLRHAEVGTDPAALGALVAQVLLDERGGSALLARS